MTDAALFTIAAVLNSNLGGPLWVTIGLWVASGLAAVSGKRRPAPAESEVIGPLVPARREPEA